MEKTIIKEEGFNEELHKEIDKMQSISDDLEVLIMFESVGLCLTTEFCVTVAEYETGEIPEWFAEKSFKELIERLSEYAEIEVPRSLRRIKKYRNKIVSLIKGSRRALGTGDNRLIQSNMLKLGYFMPEYGKFFEKEKERVGRRLKRQVDKINELDPSLLEIGKEVNS